MHKGIQHTHTREMFRDIQGERGKVAERARNREKKQKRRGGCSCESADPSVLVARLSRFISCSRYVPLPFPPSPPPSAVLSARWLVLQTEYFWFWPLALAPRGEVLTVPRAVAPTRGPRTLSCRGGAPESAQNRADQPAECCSCTNTW